MEEIRTKIGFEDVGKYIRDAAHQCLYMDARLQDCLDATPHIHTHYAVDTDVLVFFTNPEFNRTFEYAKFFHDNDDQTCLTLARALADYLFFHLVLDNEPLIIIPPHDDEINSVYYNVARKAEGEDRNPSVSEEISQVEELIEAYENTKNEKAFIDGLEKKAPTLVKILYGDGGTASEELKRFLTLLEKKRVMTIRWLNEKEDISTDSSWKSLRRLYQNRDESAIRCLRDKWFDRLYNENKDKDETKLSRDAEVLGVIEWMNGRLKDKKESLVLISGDSTINRASQKYDPENIKPCFANRYIRHPRAFISETAQLAMPQSSEGSQDRKMARDEIDLGIWLQVFLAQTLDSNDRYDTKDLLNLIRMPETNLYRIAQDMYTRYPESFNDLKDKWLKLTGHIALVHGFKSLRLMTEHVAKELIEFYNKFNRPEIRRMIYQKTEEVWEALFRVAVEGGQGLLFAAPEKDRLPSRSIPGLQFFDLPEAQLYVNRIIESKPDRDMEIDKQMLNVLKSKDISGYYYYLAFGLYFAAGNCWQITSILSNRALRIADSGEPFSKEVNSGHEAAYLLTIAKRHANRSVGDLPYVEGLLADAYRRVRSYYNNKEILDARLESEINSIYVTYHLYNSFNNNSIPKRIPSLLDCQNRLLKLLDLIGNEKFEIVRTYVERETIINLFMIVFIRQFRNNETIGDIKQFQRLLGQLDENLRGRGNSDIPVPSLTYKINIIHLAATWFYGEGEKREEAIVRLKEALTDTEIAKASVRTYDEQRYKFIREIVRQFF